MSLSVIELFEEKTQYDLKSFLESVSLFIKQDYPVLIEFYSVKKNQGFNVKGTILKLDELYNEVETILSLVQNSSGSFTPEFWEIVEMLDELKLSLEYMKNTPKWLRSVISKGKYSYSFENNEVLKQRETLENLTSRLGSSNRDNDWVYIALRNNLDEEDYTLDGGIDLTVQFFNKLSLVLNTVVDTNIVGEKVYGKDFSKKIRFVEGEGIEVLGYKETIKQAVDILCKLKSGDNPEFPQDGIPSSILGGNRNTFPVQILKRQIQQAFQKDDTLKSLLITHLQIKEDSISVNLQVETRINEVIEGVI